MSVDRSAGIIIFKNTPDGRKYLVLRSSRNEAEISKPEFWDFPKGLLEKGEKGIDAAIREVKEEVGIENFSFVGGFKETVHYFTRRDGKPVPKFVVMFLAEVKDDKVKLSWEHDKYEWLSFAEARERISRVEMKKTLDAAQECLSKK